MGETPGRVEGRLGMLVHQGARQLAASACILSESVYTGLAGAQRAGKLNLMGRMQCDTCLRNT